MPQLKLINSITKEKELFAPKNGKRVNWYCCGPTVDEQVHLGHARTYISFDILRRVLSHVFGYTVYYVMNITDIDDKIITKARQDHLYSNYIQQRHSVKTFLRDMVAVTMHVNDLMTKAKDPISKKVYRKWRENMNDALPPVQKQIYEGEDTSDEQKKFFAAARQPLSSWLEKNSDFSGTGSSIDRSIFRDFSKKWEDKFLADMELLNIEAPDVLTRASDYIPEIERYIKVVVENGCAYETNGSVFFRRSRFEAAGNRYAKLVPEAARDAAKLKEGEGELTTYLDRWSEFDFVLWKSPNIPGGEPWWSSCWGIGRPGWHVQCAAMASAVFGENVDIHSGGIDLKFPHHDNEIALSEAYHRSDNWVKYFLHSGHLTRAGLKMSKSHGNVITVDEALTKYTARQLRIAFLMHSWHETLDYSDKMMKHAVDYEEMLTEFLLAVKVSNQNATELSKTHRKWGQEDRKLIEKFSSSEEMILSALSDNIDTPLVLAIIRELISHCNLAISNKTVGVRLLYKVASYIKRMMTIFGVFEDMEGLGSFCVSPNLKFESKVMPCLTEIQKCCQRLEGKLLPQKE